MNTKKWKIALLIGFIIGTRGICWGQPPEAPVDFRKHQEYGQFNGRFLYKKAEALRGRQNIDFVIQIHAFFPGEGDIEHLSLQDLKALGDANIKFQFHDSRLCESVEPLFCKEFIYTLHIGKDVIPRRYMIPFKLRYQTFDPIEINTGFLVVGTNQEGLLQVAERFKADAPRPIKIFESTWIHIPLKNNFPDYTISVEPIDEARYEFVKGNKGDYKVLDTRLPGPLWPGEEGEMVLEIQGGIPWNRFFSANFSPEDILEFNVNYRDEFDRVVQDFRVSVPLDLDISDLLLYAALLLPLIAGTVVGNVLRSHRDKKNLLSRDLVLSLLVGFIFYTLVFTGEVKISVLGFSSSKDTLGTLLIGFASGWGGLGWIDKFFGSAPSAPRQQ